MKLEKLKRGEKELIQEIVAIFDKMIWKLKSPKIGNPRKNIFKTKEKAVPIKAFVLGLVRDYAKSKLVPSTHMKWKKYQKIFELLKSLMKKHNPKFTFTSIQINNKVPTNWHKDKKNKGLSYCIGVGDFTGGGVDIKVNKKIINYDNHNKWLLYDGANFEHRTAKFKGNRYAIIFYTAT